MQVIFLKITENMIKEISSDTIYKRGVEFFREGRLHIKGMDEGSVQAVADGEQIYNISIKFGKGKVEEYFCTCPYYHTMGSACRHIVAALKMCRRELEEGEGFENENDKLAALLCSEYTLQNSEKKRINLGFSLNIYTSSAQTGFAIGIKAGEEALEPVSAGAFVRGLLRENTAVISKHRRLDMKEYTFGKDEAELLKILTEAEDCNRAEYRERGEFSIGGHTVERVMPLLSRLECEYRVDGMPCHDLRIIDDNPDILVDVTATANKVSMAITERGTALTRKGEWFLFEGNIYRTTQEWQSWFMPIYRTVIAAKRTQLDFTASNAVEFIRSVLPQIRGKQGVILNGFEDVIVDTKPEFEVIIENQRDGISALPIVYYGTIGLKLSERVQQNDKILIRHERLEQEVKSFFDGFELIGDRFVTDDTDLVFEFITKRLAELKSYAKVIYNDEITVEHNLPIKVRVGYAEGVNLLDVGFETNLSPDEIYGILEAVRLKKSYYRRADGSFVIADTDEFSALKLLSTLGFSKSDIEDGGKRVASSNVFYLSELARSGRIIGENSFQEFIKSIEEIKPKIPEHIDKVLRGYQRDGVRWLCQLSKCGFGGILADDMGLGKTLQVIAFVMSTERDKPALVVAPSSLTYNWQNEIAKFAPEARSVIVEGVKGDRIEILENSDDVDFVITSYPLMRRDMELYRKKEFSFFFIDEAQYIKNPATINAKSVKRIKAGGYFALTGTPIENSLGELWSIFDFVMKGYLSSQKDFLARFQSSIMKEEDSGAIAELRGKIQPFILRRMKKDVLAELPEKIEETIYSGLEAEQKRLYEAYLKVAKNEVQYMSETNSENHMRILSLLMRLRQICCHPKLFDSAYKEESGKLQLFEELVSSGVAAGHRILVFSQFTSMLAIIKESLERLGISYFYLDGSTHSEERIELANRFNGGEREVFLISLKAGGTGLNLIGADMVIHYDPWWNPAVMDQASDRAHRIGQKKAVQVIKLAAKGTIEEQIIKLQEKKKALADEVITENSRLLSGLTKEEIMAMLT